MEVGIGGSLGSGETTLRESWQEVVRGAADSVESDGRMVRVGGRGGG
jgi:hypothetical protein